MLLTIGIIFTFLLKGTNQQTGNQGGPGQPGGTGPPGIASTTSSTVGIIYTFPTPSVTPSTPSIIKDCYDCGLCGFCTDRSTSRCYCYEGCQYDYNANACKDIDECLYQPCIYGTCTNVMGTYYCKCSSGYAGRDCDKPLNDPNAKPSITGMKRARGILAGGGEVEVEGLHFDLFPPINVTFRSFNDIILRAGFSRNDRISSERFFVTIPRTEAKNVGVNFTITIGFTTDDLIDIPGKFVYTDNPTIANITPINPLVTPNGGAMLIISGTNLDVPTRTIILIQIEIFNYTVNIFKGDGNTTCNPHNSSEIICPMPNFKIRNDSSWLNNTDKLTKSLSPTIQPDAYEIKRLNITPSFRPPRIESTSELLYYDPENHEILTIKGDYGDNQTTSLEDYIVEIGDRNCTTIYLGSRILQCMPPESPPRALQSSVYACKSDGTAVYVNAFGYHQFARCVKYYNSRLPLIIAFSVASILMVVFFIVIGYIMCKLMTCPIINTRENSNYTKAITRMRRDTLSSDIVNNGISSMYAQDNVWELENFEGGATTDTGTRIKSPTKSLDTVSEDDDASYIKPN